MSLMTPGGILVGAAIQVAPELWAMVRAIVEAPARDDLMMPFAPSGRCHDSPAHSTPVPSVDADGNVISGVGAWETVPVEGPVHPLYAEAFARLQTLTELGLAAGVDPGYVEAARALVAEALNAGIYAVAGGYQCEATERPKLGQADALLEAFAESIGRRATNDRVAALGAAVATMDATPLRVAARPAGISPLALLAGAGVLGGLWLALRGAV